MRLHLAACAAVVLTTFCTVTAQAKPVTLKFAFFANQKERTWTTTLKPFIEAVNKAGKGVVQIKAYPNGELGRGMAQQAQMLLDGVADIAFVLPALTPGRFADDEVMELPGIVRNVEDATLIYTKMLRGGKIKGFGDYYVIAALGGDPFPISTRKPIKGLADLKGMKIRVGGRLQAMTMKALGIVPVLMPINEVPEAIARGTIDGTAIQPVPMVDFGVVRVVKYHYFAGLGFSPLTVLMSKKKFDSLPKAAKAIIEKYSGKWINDLYDKRFSAASRAVVKKLQDDPNHKVIYPTAAEKKTLHAAFDKVINQWTAESVRHAKLYKELLAVQKQVRAGE